MKVVMSIMDTGAWSLDLTAQTPTEKAMLAAVSQGYDVKCACGAVGTSEEPVLHITGESGTQVRIGP